MAGSSRAKTGTGRVWLSAIGVAAALSLLPGLGRSGRVGQPEGVGVRDPLAAELERRLAEDVAPIMEHSCWRCHGEEKSKGDVQFEGISTMARVLETAEAWATAREMISTHEMPPEDEPGPSEHERLTVVQWIDDALDYYPADAPVDPGWYTIHRLNRAEYRNTLRDLLGIDPATVDLADGLPADDTGYGFDNIADVLSVSALALEAYLAAAERAIEIGLGPAVEVSDRPRPLRPLEGSRNGRPLRGGGHMLYSNGEVSGTVEIGAGGDYEIVVLAWGTRAGDELPRLSVRLDGREVGEFSIEAAEGGPQECRVALRLGAGSHRIAGAFTNDHYVPSVADRNLAIEEVAIVGPLDAAGIERPEAYGTVFFVHPAPGADAAGERTAAERVIERFASRAYRRPLRDGELPRLIGLYEASRSAGDSHEPAVRVVLAATLVSPSFLYRSLENPRGDDPGFVYALNDYELAGRLSYFLWSSMPDEELLGLAAEGALRDESVLRAQARRLLVDRRADAFVENFAGQWLLLRNLERLQIDPATYPGYTGELRADMIAEARLFFADVVRSDRSVLDLLDAGDTFLNERLAAHYGVPGVRGEAFRRVALDPASHRGGVLTMGAVLTVTSNPTRTSPVKRGLYVLDQLLGSPPPPPPPDIARLEQAAEVVGEDATLREKLAAHLFDANCAVCHRRMDPIGLAMENFDAVGRWREEEGGRPIDASGVLPGGAAFEGPDELKQILLARDGEFVENLSRKVLTYALGRGLEPFDRPTVRRISEEVRARGDRFGALIEAVVASEAFRTCRGREAGQ